MRANKGHDHSIPASRGNWRRFFFGCRKEKKLVSAAPVYSYEWKSKAVKPGRLFRLRDGSGPAVLQALFVKALTNQIDPKPLLELLEPKAPELLLWRIKQRRKIKDSNWQVSWDLKTSGCLEDSAYTQQDKWGKQRKKNARSPSIFDHLLKRASLVEHLCSLKHRHPPRSRVDHFRCWCLIFYRQLQAA